MNLLIKDTCVKCGACAQVNSEVFEIYGTGAVVNFDKINENLDSCYDAVFYCPVNAIVIA